MPRPRKRKRVHALPGNERFGPLGGSMQHHKTVAMSVEEFETIRLIDSEGLTQEESAERMDVARGTVQRLYRDARMKLADALVNVGTLIIQGGDYHVPDASNETQGRRRGHGPGSGHGRAGRRRRCQEQPEK